MKTIPNSKPCYLVIFPSLVGGAAATLRGGVAPSPTYLRFTDTPVSLEIITQVNHTSFTVPAALNHLENRRTLTCLLIPQQFDKLIISLRTAYAKEYTLDKEQTSYDDLLDSLRLSLKGYNVT